MTFKGILKNVMGDFKEFLKCSNKLCSRCSFVYCCSHGNCSLRAKVQVVSHDGHKYLMDWMEKIFRSLRGCANERMPVLIPTQINVSVTTVLD